MLQSFPRFQTIAFLCSCVFAFLVHNQLWSVDGWFASDVRLHVYFILDPGQTEAAGYSLLHAIGGLLLGLFPMSGDGRTLVACGVVLVLLVGAFYHSLTLVHGYWAEKYPAGGEGRLAMLTVATFVISMIILQPWLGALYLGVFTGNPWHNPTFIFARVFSILAFISFLKLTDPDRQAGGGGLRWWWLLAGSAVLSVWAKPSFMITLGPTFGIIVLLAWKRSNLSALRVGLLGACLLPAAGVLLLIRHYLYAAAEVAHSVVLLPGQVWGQYTPSYAMSVALAAAFPLYVVLVKGRDLSHAMGVATVNWVISALVFYLLAEAGPRETHANFAWCYMGGLFFFFLFAIEEWFLRPVVTNRWLYWLGTVIFTIHLASGCRYLLSILQGGPYM